MTKHIIFNKSREFQYIIPLEGAISKRFDIGDSLSFEYENDSVLVVEKWDFYHCNTNKPISSFDDGKTVIDLDRSGIFYFISGAIDHFIKGQKLLVQVMSLHQGLPAPVPHRSSGLVVTVTLSSVLVALIVTFVILV
ncbi:hypothetical protein HRI_003047500 [Hibiscus trionum]|uniref:Phytocyanin domain-containing protein n=1 Tax=Hibiscus trionum TaxID=183268 RepID=A0A9W7M859_HIBTR|nr:hypothetical protein HRI_003047500 [Hibiscus trionum]